MFQKCFIGWLCSDVRDEAPRHHTHESTYLSWIHKPFTSSCCIMCCRILSSHVSTSRPTVTSAFTGCHVSFSCCCSVLSRKQTWGLSELFVFLTAASAAQSRDWWDLQSNEVWTGAASPLSLCLHVRDTLVESFDTKQLSVSDTVYTLWIIHYYLVPQRLFLWDIMFLFKKTIRLSYMFLNFSTLKEISSYWMMCWPDWSFKSVYLSVWH